jgi:hypothetical protein
MPCFRGTRHFNFVAAAIGLRSLFGDRRFFFGGRRSRVVDATDATMSATHCSGGGLQIEEPCIFPARKMWPICEPPPMTRDLKAHKIGRLTGRELRTRSRRDPTNNSRDR